MEGGQLEANFGGGGGMADNREKASAVMYCAQSRYRMICKVCVDGGGELYTGFGGWGRGGGVWGPTGNRQLPTAHKAHLHAGASAREDVEADRGSGANEHDHEQNKAAAGMCVDRPGCTFGPTHLSKSWAGARESLLREGASAGKRAPVLGLRCLRTCIVSAGSISTLQTVLPTDLHCQCSQLTECACPAICQTCRAGVLKSVWCSWP
eukprot:352312-Chlamydomonas_euryale.AAC.3